MMCLSTVTSAQAIEQILSTKDAVIGYHYGINSANTNYNSADWYGAMSQQGNHGGPNHARSLIYFDLTAYPQGTPVDDATLDLFGRGPVAGTGAAATVGNTGANFCVIERITSTWLDYTVTWNTAPSYTSINSVTLPISSQTIEDYEGIDVTDMVQDMINAPSTSHGFMIRLVVEEPTRSLFFCGNSYSDPAKRPRLNLKVNTNDMVESITRLSSNLFPNPVLRGQNVRLDGAFFQSVDTIDLIDTQGRLRSSTAWSGSAFIVPEDLEPGTYVPQLRSGKSLFARLKPIQVID